MIKGWRRESGKTRIENIFLRAHLLEKLGEVDKFMDQGKKTRLYVSGPPGSGKTTFFLAYFTQWARTKQKSALIVQYRDIGACEIILLDGEENPKYVVDDERLNRESLSGLVGVLINDLKPHFCVLDGVRQKIDACTNIISRINSLMNDRRAVRELARLRMGLMLI